MTDCETISEWLTAAVDCADRALVCKRDGRLTDAYKAWDEGLVLILKALPLANDVEYEKLLSTADLLLRGICSGAGPSA